MGSADCPPRTAAVGSASVRGSVSEFNSSVQKSALCPLICPRPSRLGPVLRHYSLIATEMNSSYEAFNCCSWAAPLGTPFSTLSVVRAGDGRGVGEEGIPMRSMVTRYCGVQRKVSKLSGLGALVDHTVFHHEDGLRQCFDVLRRIPFNGDDIGELARFERADAIFPTQQPGPVSGACHKGVLRVHAAPFDKQLERVIAPWAVTPASVPTAMGTSWLRPVEWPWTSPRPPPEPFRRGAL